MISYGLWCFHDMVRACSSVKCIPPLELNLEWLEWLESIRSPIPGGQWIGTGTAIATLRLGRTPGNLGRRSSWDVTRHWKGHKKHIEMFMIVWTQNKSVFRLLLLFQAQTQLRTLHTINVCMLHISYIYISYIYTRKTIQTKFSVRTGLDIFFVRYVFFPNTAMSGCKPSTYRLI